MADKFITTVFDDVAGNLTSSAGLDTAHFVCAAEMVIAAALDVAGQCGCSGCVRAAIGLRVAALALSNISGEAPPVASRPVGRA